MSYDYDAERDRLIAEHKRSDRKFRAVVAAVVVAVALGVWWLIANVTDEHGDACRAAGGVVKSNTKSATGINPSNGQPVITTITINACINKEGNVTDVW